MPMGRHRKIQVPTDNQPQFQLGDTAEDIAEEEEGERGDGGGEGEDRTGSEGQRGWRERGGKKVRKGEMTWILM